MASAGNKLFEIVADPRRNPWDGQARGRGLLVDAESAETQGERWVTRGAPADIGPPGRNPQFEIVDSVRRNPWEDKQPGPGFVVGETENIVEEPSVEENNSQFQIVDDPRNGRIDPWKGTTPGRGLVFGEATQRPNRRVEGLFENVDKIIE